MLELSNSDYTDDEVEEFYKQSQSIQNADRITHQQNLANQALDRLEEVFGVTSSDGVTVTINTPTPRGDEIAEILADEEQVKDMSQVELYKLIKELGDLPRFYNIKGPLQTR